MKMVRTSVDIPNDLYRAFQQMGGVLSVVVREAVRDYLGLKGASEDSLAITELKHQRLSEEKRRFEDKVQEVDGQLAVVDSQLIQIKSNIKEKNQVNDQAKLMREKINPYIRSVGYEVKIITPELHNMLLDLADVGLEHNLESLQKWAMKLENADYLGGYRGI